MSRRNAATSSAPRSPHTPSAPITPPATAITPVNGTPSSGSGTLYIRAYSTPWRRPIRCAIRPDTMKRRPKRIRPLNLPRGQRFQQARRDTFPAPALHGRSPRRSAELGTRRRWEGKQLVEPRRELFGVACREARQVPLLRRVLRLQTLCDFGKAGVTRNERRRAGCRRLGRDHPEGLREDRGDNGNVRERKQVDEVAVLERPGEERARRGDSLELRAIVAEADDHGARVDRAQRLEQNVDALVVEQFPEVDDGRLVAAEKVRQPLGIPLVRKPLVRVPGIGRVRAGLSDQPGERFGTSLGLELMDVHPGRYLVDAIDVSD